MTPSPSVRWRHRWDRNRPSDRGPPAGPPFAPPSERLRFRIAVRCEAFASREQTRGPAEQHACSCRGWPILLTCGGEAKRLVGAFAFQCPAAILRRSERPPTLTIRAAKNPGYYEQPEFARDDYYTEHDSVPGQWVGRGAESLSLRGAPGKGQLGTLLEGRDPRTGDELPGGRGRRPSNAGFDLTFTAPKSVSVLLAVGDEEIQRAILDAQERAVRAGLDYLERHECFARRGTNGVDVIPAEGFVGGMYTHEMARSGDPHLHTHVVIANRVRSPSDGRWTAPDMRPVYAAAKTAGTIGEAVLRDELTQSLGVRWNQVRNGTAEIEGVPQEVLDHFSQRHTEILELAAVRGWLTERGIEEIQRETRDRKPQIDRDIAQARWQARAAEHGFGAAELDAVIDRPRRRPDVDEAHAAPASSSDPAGSPNRNPHSPAARCSRRSPARIGMALRSRNWRRSPTTSWLTTRSSSPRGSATTRRATRPTTCSRSRPIFCRSPPVTSKRLQPVPAGIVEKAIDESPIPLGPDQADAVRHLTSGTQRTRLLEARAGYGKTAALAAVAEAYRADGELVIGTAWQGETAQRMQREAGITSQTTAGLLNSIQRGWSAIPQGAVVIVDEASMMPTRSLAELAGHVAPRRRKAHPRRRPRPASIHRRRRSLRQPGRPTRCRAAGGEPPSAGRAATASRRSPRRRARRRRARTPGRARALRQL